MKLTRLHFLCSTIIGNAIDRPGCQSIDINVRIDTPLLCLPLALRCDRYHISCCLYTCKHESSQNPDETVRAKGNRHPQPQCLDPAICLRTCCTSIPMTRYLRIQEAGGRQRTWHSSSFDTAREIYSVGYDLGKKCIAMNARHTRYFSDVVFSPLMLANSAIARIPRTPFKARFALVPAVPSADTAHALGHNEYLQQNKSNRILT